MDADLQVNQADTPPLSMEENARLLAHPLPSLQWALYDTLKASNEPLAIFADRGAAMFCNSELYTGTCEIREIKLFSDRMPVAEPIQPKWRSDT
jgi:hypothetical protein